MNTRLEDYRKKELRKGLAIQPRNFGDQSTSRIIDFRLDKIITSEFCRSISSQGRSRS